MTVAINDLIVGPTVPSSGVTTISVDFYVADESWVKVYKSGSETPLTITTDYTFSGVGTSSGTVTLVTPANGTDSYSVYLEVPLERSADLQLRGQFRSGPMNDELDRLWHAIQLLNTLSSRSLRFSRNSANPDPITSETAIDRADKVLTFDASGDPILATTLDAGSVPVTSFAETLLDDATQGEMQTTLGLDSKADDTDASIANSITLTGATQDWEFALSGDNLVIKYNGTSLAMLTTGGNFTVIGDITAFGTLGL